MPKLICKFPGCESDTSLRQCDVGIESGKVERPGYRHYDDTKCITLFCPVHGFKDDRENAYICFKHVVTGYSK